MNRSTGPSVFWTRVLERFVPDGDREHIVGELRALYELQEARAGRRAANARYRREVMAYVMAALFRSKQSQYASRATPSFPGRVVTGVWRDVRLAGRSLRRTPGFTAVAVLTLTLGIGANTLIFTVVDHVALRPLPFNRPDELVKIWPNFALTRGELEMLQRNSETLTEIAGFIRTDGYNFLNGGVSRRVEGNAVTPGLLETLGVVPMVGRSFLPSEAHAGEDGVVLLSFRFWQSEFGADETIVGKQIVIDGRSRTVIGILPRGLDFPDGRQDVLLPIVMQGNTSGEHWGFGGYEAIGRLAPSATYERATAEARALTERIRLANPVWTPAAGYRDQSTVVSLRTAMVGDIRPTLLVLAGAVGLVLLVACANVSNLLLARGLSRSREVAVRSALGASRWRLLREQLIESLMIACAGIVVALGSARLALHGLLSLLPSDVPRRDAISLDGRVVFMCILFALAAGLIAGLVPALRNSHAQPAAAMREGGRSQTGGRRHRRLTAAMILVQVAVAVVLVTNAGLLVRSLDALRRVDTGFDSEGVMTARLTLAGEGFSNADARYAYYRRLVDRVAVVPGVQSASIGRRVPFGPGNGQIATFIDGVTNDPNSLPVFSQNQIMPGYLETLRVPLLEGRLFTEADGADAVKVAVIDQSIAGEYFPDGSPIGRRIRYPWSGAPWIQIVGVVAATADGDLSADPIPSFYVPLAQNGSDDVTLILRADADGVIDASSIRAIVREVDARVPASAIVPLNSLIGASQSRPRLSAMLLAAFAGVALILGCVGVYGVAAYSVRSRSPEIGLRLALGASEHRIRGEVIRQGVMLTLPGVVVGMLVAIPSARMLESLLFGVSPLDPATFALVPFLLFAAGIVAVYVPARRAMRVDPVEALRGE